MITIDVNIDGAMRRFDTLADFAGDLELPLRKFGAHLRRRALERYKAQDFDPLAPATVEKRAQKGLRALERKLTQDVRKAVGRARDKELEGSGVLGRLFGRGAATARAEATRGVQNRLAVLAEFQRRHRPGGELVARADLKPLSLKQLVSLGGREDRAVAKAVGAPILGGLPRTLVVEVDGSTVTLASRTGKHWTAVHNEGGQAGRGARIPKRETIRVDDSDLDVLAEILREHHLLAFAEEE